MKIQSSLFHVNNRKRLTRKLILCGFEPCVLLNFKASAAETGIFHGWIFSKPCFLLNFKASAAETGIFLGL
jgi:hypothetical protein